MAKVSIIIPTRNREEQLQICLSHLAGQEAEIIVVDNGDLKKIPANVTYVKETRVGRVYAKNAGIKKATGELLIFLDDDMLVENDFVAKHWQSYQKNKTITLGKIVGVGNDNLNRFLNSGTFIKKSRELQRLIFFHTTANISIPAKFLENNLFDEDFYRYGYEDLELGFRLFKQGYKLVIDETIQTVHDHLYTLEGYLQNKFQAGINLVILLNKYPDIQQYLTMPPFMVGDKFWELIARLLIRLDIGIGYKLLIGIYYIRGIRVGKRLALF